MSRFRLAIVLASLLAPVAAHAQSQAELAEKLNDEGKQLMYESKYPEASYKFQQAVARVAEPKYFFNLCVSQTNEGKLNEAYANCISAKGNASAELTAKADKMIAKIQDTAKAQNVELQEPGGAAGRDPATNNNNPPPPNGNNPPPPNDGHTPPNPRVGTAEPPPTAGSVRYARYQPPAENLAVGRGPDNNYTWTLGVDLTGGGGQIGQKNAYGSAAVGFRVKADVLFDPVHRLGAEGYLQYNHLGQGSNQTALVNTLDVVDIGGALYKHFCLGGRLCVTPLLGLHLALMSPAGEQDAEGSQLFNYAAVGGRGEVALSYAFGPRFEHVFSIAAGVNVYSKVLSGPADSDPMSIAAVGLDQAGAIGYLGIGYTYRFNTPLGVAPFITLE
jgi:hypothetical protein